MSSVDRLSEIANRLEHLEAAAEWIAKTTVHHDSGVSQTGTLITVLSDDIRDLLCTLVCEMEREYAARGDAENLH